jgi:GNAT superfamily N-acetyltransferase
MNLNEVYVRDDSYPLDGSICPATHPIGRGSCAGSYRNKGIGTELLKLAVNCARKRRLKFICASVTKEDISKTPYLLEWYERRGFKKSGRYKGCIPDAVAWVCMQLD